MADTPDDGKFCVNCKYHEEWDKARWTYDRHRCNFRESNTPAEETKRDPVTGERVVPIENCHALRRDDRACGPQGRWWEKRSDKIAISTRL